MERLVIGGRGMVSRLGLVNQRSGLDVRCVDSLTLRVYNPLCFQDPSEAMSSDTRLFSSDRAERSDEYPRSQDESWVSDKKRSVVGSDN